MKNLFRVEILGREYTIRSDEGEERVQAIAKYVNQKIKEAAEGTQSVSTLNAAVLAALHIAYDYFQAREEENVLSRQVEAKSGRLIEMIDSRIMG